MILPSSPELEKEVAAARASHLFQFDYRSKAPTFTLGVLVATKLSDKDEFRSDSARSYILIADASRHLQKQRALHKNPQLLFELIKLRAGYLRAQPMTIKLSLIK